MNDIKKLVEAMRDAAGQCNCGLTMTRAAASLERLSAENADLRARLEQAEKRDAFVLESIAGAEDGIACLDRQLRQAERERDEALALLNEKDAALQAARENPNDFARSVERGGHIVTERCLRQVLKERDEARADLDRFKKNWFSARSELEVSERAQEQLRADLERAQAEAAAMRETLEKFNQWWFAQNYESDITGFLDRFTAGPGVPDHGDGV